MVRQGPRNGNSLSLPARNTHSAVPDHRIKTFGKIFYEIRRHCKPRGGSESLWASEVPVRVRALVLAGDTLFAAGAPLDAFNELGERDPDCRGLLLAVSSRTGKIVDRFETETPPVFDGMAAAGGRLYVTLENGRLICLEGKDRDR